MQLQLTMARLRSMVLLVQVQVVPHVVWVQVVHVVLLPQLLLIAHFSLAVMRPPRMVHLAVIPPVTEAVRGGLRWRVWLRVPHIVLAAIPRLLLARVAHRLRQVLRYRIPCHHRHCHHRPCRVVRQLLRRQHHWVRHRHLEAVEPSRHALRSARRSVVLSLLHLALRRLRHLRQHSLHLLRLPHQVCLCVISVLMRTPLQMPLCYGVLWGHNPKMVLLVVMSTQVHMYVVVVGVVMRMWVVMQVHVHLYAPKNFIQEMLLMAFMLLLQLFQQLLLLLCLLLLLLHQRQSLLMSLTTQLTLQLLRSSVRWRRR